MVTTILLLSEVKANRQSAERGKSNREKRYVCGNEVCERVIALQSSLRYVN